MEFLSVLTRDTLWPSPRSTPMLSRSKSRTGRVAATLVSPPSVMSWSKSPDCLPSSARWWRTWRLVILSRRRRPSAWPAREQAHTNALNSSETKSLRSFRTNRLLSVPPNRRRSDIAPCAICEVLPQTKRLLRGRWERRDEDRMRCATMLEQLLSLTQVFLVRFKSCFNK